jgi:tyrosyl-tRNA synthetase
MLNKGRHTRDGKVMLNILKYDVMFVVQHWGYLQRKDVCEFFEYVVSLFKEELGENKENKKNSVKKKQELNNEIVSD